MKKALFSLMFALLPMSAHADAQLENHPQAASIDSSEDYRVSYEDNTIIVDDLKSWKDLRAAGVPEEEMRTCLVRIENKSKFKYAKWWGNWKGKMTLAFQKIRGDEAYCYRRGCLTKSRVKMEYQYYPDRDRMDKNRVERTLRSSIGKHSVCREGRTYAFRTLSHDSVKLD